MTPEITYNSVDNCMLCLYAVNAVVRCDACDHTASASASVCLLRACCAVYDAQDKVKPRKSYAWSQLQNVSQKKKNRFELEVSVISVVLPHMGYSVTRGATRWAVQRALFMHTESDSQSLLFLPTTQYKLMTSHLQTNRLDAAPPISPDKPYRGSSSSSSSNNAGGAGPAVSNLGTPSANVSCCTVALLH